MYWIPLLQFLEAREVHCFLVRRASDCACTQAGCFPLPMAAASPFCRFAQRIVRTGTDGLHGAFDLSSDLAQMASSHVQHIQKVPDQMNLELHHVISDITALTGLAISRTSWRASVAALRDRRTKVSEDAIDESLVRDHWRELLFAPGQPLKRSRHC